MKAMIYRLFILSLFPLASAFAQPEYHWQLASGSYLNDPGLAIITGSGNRIQAITAYRIQETLDSGRHWTTRLGGTSTNLSFYYADTGQTHFILAGNTLYRTTDNGIEWNVNRTNITHGISLISRRSRYWFEAGSNNYETVSRSFNQGLTWQTVFSGSLFGYNLVESDSGTLVYGCTYGPYRSIDFGSSWQPICPIASGITEATSVHFTRHSSLLTLQYLYSTRTLKIYRSTNNGTNWQNSDSLCSVGIADNIRWFEYGDSISLMTSVGAFISTNDGVNWARATSIPVIPICIDSTGGKYRFDDNQMVVYQPAMDSIWHNITYSVPTANAFSGLPQRLQWHRNRILAVNVGGIYSSTDYGDHWNQTMNIRSVHVVSLLVDSSSAIFAGTDAGLLRSENDGENWSSYPDLNRVKTIKRLNNRQLLISQDSILYRSDDNGDTWTSLGSPFHQFGATDFIASASGTWFACVQCPTSATNPTAGIYRSPDQGDSWTASNRGLVFRNVSSLAIAPNGYLFATVDVSGSTRASGLYRSTDDGYNWYYILPTEIGTGQGISPIYLDSTGMYLFSNGTILHTTNWGNNWESISDTLGYVSPVSFFRAPTGAFFTNLSAKIFRASGSTKIVSPHDPISLPQQPTLIAPYPNPFNASTEIRYQLAQAGAVTLTVYDLTGRAVTELVNTHQQSGEYVCRFDGQTLPSGTYFVQLRVGTISRTQKIVLLK